MQIQLESLLQCHFCIEALRKIEVSFDHLPQSTDCDIKSGQKNILKFSDFSRNWKVCCRFVNMATIHVST
jgi:hypothetical protein